MQSFYNWFCLQVGGWTPPPGAHLTAMQTVNPFMHLAARAGIPGLVTSNVQASTTQTKEEKQDHGVNTVHIVQVKYKIFFIYRVATMYGLYGMYCPYIVLILKKSVQIRTYFFL